MSVKEAPVLVILEGDYPIKNWLLDRPQMVIGRDDTCDIIIPQRQISRQHVVIHHTPDGALIEDLNSRNGTWVNGLRLEGTRPLNDGDEIHLALTVRLRYVASGSTAPVTQDLPDVLHAPQHSSHLRLDPDGRRVFVGSVEVKPPLSVPQYRLLELLYTQKGRVCTREEVVAYVWPDVVGEGVSEQAIDALVRRLRDRLAEIDSKTNFIVTVRGHGFRLENA